MNYCCFKIRIYHSQCYQTAWPFCCMLLGYLVYSASSDMLCTSKNVCCFKALFIHVYTSSFVYYNMYDFLYIGSVNTFYFDDYKCMNGSSKNLKEPR